MVFESKTSAAMMMSFIEGDNGDSGQLVRRRKKRRAADAKVKKFSGEFFWFIVSFSALHCHILIILLCQ